MPYSGIHKLIDSGKWKTIFWTCIVQIGEVNASPPLHVGFLHKHGIRYPLWVEGPFDKTI